MTPLVLGALATTIPALAGTPYLALGTGRTPLGIHAALPVVGAGITVGTSLKGPLGAYVGGSYTTVRAREGSDAPPDEANVHVRGGSFAAGLRVQTDLGTEHWFMPYATAGTTLSAWAGTSGEDKKDEDYGVEFEDGLAFMGGVGVETELSGTVGLGIEMGLMRMTGTLDDIDGPDLGEGSALWTYTDLHLVVLFDRKEQR